MLEMGGALAAHEYQTRIASSGGVLYGYQRYKLVMECVSCWYVVVASSVVAIFHGALRGAQTPARTAG